MGLSVTNIFCTLSRAAVMPNKNQVAHCTALHIHNTKSVHVQNLFLKHNSFLFTIILIAPDTVPHQHCSASHFYINC